MPNGGSDNCETCGFNSTHEGKTGYGDGLPCRCVIRDVQIEHTYHTYCANHPHHNPRQVRAPIGPIYVCGDPEPGGTLYPRVLWKPSPDTEEIRGELIRLLEGIPAEAAAEYPSPTRFEPELIRQLGEFKETRAVPGLRRVLQLPPYSRAQATQGWPGEVMIGGEPLVDRMLTLGRAMEALAKILGSAAIADLSPFVRKGIEKPGLPLEVYEKYATLRYWAVTSLALCGPDARPGLELATADPVDEIALEARKLLGPG